MKAHKINQKEFAEYIGIPIGTLWNWVYRDIIPDTVTSCGIAEALGTTVEFLVRGTGDINAEDRMQRTSERKSASEEILKLAGRIAEETRRLK